ncbi:MAG: hypothetical protein KKB30_15115 [Proteobacteria bacterium]|nr:hypothetical protein [Pseudomonadota bacterium]MBU1716254.1 hypothetical protein [Pseudomonadota bacterium]
MLIRSGLVLCLLLTIFVFASQAWSAHPHDVHDWSEQERQILRSLSLETLGSLPVDPSNAYSADQRAVNLGKKIFFDVKFSGNNKVSCATCHREDMDFTDDLSRAHGMGTTRRRSMPLAGLAYSSWFFWDGRKDSLWSQALGPIESPLEHGISRTLAARLILDNYQDEYEAIFGPLPNFIGSKLPFKARPDADNPEIQAAWNSLPVDQRQSINVIYANVGKSIAAYVRLILPGLSRFDYYLQAVSAGDKKVMAELFSRDEATGLHLFVGRAKCINCHNGPLLSNFDFHNVGVPQPDDPGPDRGRAEGIAVVLQDEFNCLGQYSDAGKRDCAELRFMDNDPAKYLGAFKTPSLRNVARRPPYMHAGQFVSLKEVLRHYRRVRPGGRISPELAHGGLTDEDLIGLEAFLGTLNGPIISP